eukprot:CAMPEP_0179160126 /NCGR_PEP_ID=MMETSP0796-20121207/78251_1 /TAXON_ID=73915 /ORGANISM="Pyrodinium bahamense, Strain pbaha01" /LENGTH=49 /DNA_ID=CAMNT_0020861991 /DNA_START=100 /DNA_END=249 /DNA_ORIENTATION=+
MGMGACPWQSCGSASLPQRVERVPWVGRTLAASEAVVGTFFFRADAFLC